MAENFKMTAIFCTGCNDLLNISKMEAPLYIDKRCKCGSISFYITEINIKLIVDRPNREPILKWNGMEFFE